jgi:hypothetical protein
MLCAEGCSPTDGGCQRQQCCASHHQPMQWPKNAVSSIQHQCQRCNAACREVLNNAAAAALLTNICLLCLCSQGADAWAVDKLGSTALHYGAGKDPAAEKLTKKMQTGRHTTCRRVGYNSCAYAVQACLCLARSCI